MSKALFVLLLFGFFCVSAWSAGRESIHVVGSSTVFPFTKVVADRFANTTKFRGPNVEATGTGGGFKVFCQGLGAKRPDIVNASRRIKHSEFEQCVKNGVTGIVEVPIGYDGIVLVNSIKAPNLKLTPREIYLALAKEVPSNSGKGQMVKNPYRKWSEVNPNLPDQPIQVFGPPPSSGTRDSFVEMAMETGCKTFSQLAALSSSNSAEFLKACHVMRGAPEFIEVGERDSVIIDRVESNKKAVGILGFNYLDQNSHRIQGAIIDGWEPSYENINDHVYPISRPLYFYVKKAHIRSIPGIQEFLQEFTSERAWGDEGYLSAKGLVPLEPHLRVRVAEGVQSMEVLKAQNL